MDLGAKMKNKKKQDDFYKMYIRYFNNKKLIQENLMSFIRIHIKFYKMM